VHGAQQNSLCAQSLVACLAPKSELTTEGKRYQSRVILFLFKANCVSFPHIQAASVLAFGST
jgi:hypothetical protein